MRRKHFDIGLRYDLFGYVSKSIGNNGKIVIYDYIGLKGFCTRKKSVNRLQI